MKYTKLAIERAIEGGFTNYAIGISVGDEFYIPNIGLSEGGNSIFLDPKFWQALGETEGWGKRRVYKETSIYPIMPEEFIETNPTERHGVTTELGSLHYQHRFIDAINKGKTYEQFFEGLLKT